MAQAAGWNWRCRIINVSQRLQYALVDDCPPHLFSSQLRPIEQLSVSERKYPRGIGTMRPARPFASKLLVAKENVFGVVHQRSLLIENNSPSSVGRCFGSSHGVLNFEIETISDTMQSTQRANSNSIKLFLGTGAT